MKVSLMIIITLLASCSQANSTASQNKRVETVVPTNEVKSPQAEPTPTNVEVTKTWEGKIGENPISWDGKDLVLKLKTGKAIAIFSELAKSDLRFQQKENNVSDCLIDYYFRPLGIVGNLVSFETESATLCGAINTPSWGYATIELKKNGSFVFSSPKSSVGELQDVNLSSIFSEEDIFKGLLANERIASDLSKLTIKGKINKQPDNLTELDKLFKRFEYDFLNGQFYLDREALNGFAIHHVTDDNKVSVWVGLVSRVRGGNALREHLELFLPMPEQLRQGLLLADSKKEGFLMKDSENIVGTSSATFEFGGKKD